MLDKEFELLTLKDIFDSGKRQLSVPDYQRGYSWEEEQRKDLIGDITQIITQNHRHFTGTIVASQNDESTVFDLVDGQQRITSLVIFMSSLLRAAKAQDMAELNTVPLSVIEGVYVRSGIETGNTCYQLQLGTIRDPLFHEILNDGQPVNQKVKNKADQNIVDAVKQFDVYLSEKENTELENIYKAVTEKLGFLLYAPKKDAEIGIMFEVINNRGKPLSELEKIKNYLIYFAGRHGISDLKTKVNDSWPVLLESLNTADYVSNDDENRFLRVCWIVFEDYNKSKSYHVYENLKRVCPADDASHWPKLSSFVEFITNTAKTYANLFDSSSSDLLETEKSSLQRIALHPAQASILPLVVALYSREVNVERRIKILDVLEKLNFRYYIAGIATRNDSSQGELFELAYVYHKNDFSGYENVGVLDSTDYLYVYLVWFIGENANDQRFVQYLTLDKNESGDYYKWQGLKFFMASYEDSLLEKGNKGSRLSQLVAAQDSTKRNDFYQKEHIWAIGEDTVIDDSHTRNINKRRLGNFVLLSAEINRDVGKQRPEIKVERYFEHAKLQPDTLMIRELKQDFDKAKEAVDASGEYKRQVKSYWYSIYQKFLDIREQRLVNFAIKRWGVDGIFQPVESVIINSGREENELFKCLPCYVDQVQNDIDEPMET
jgi:hypothetical protein